MATANSNERVGGLQFQFPTWEFFENSPAPAYVCRVLLIPDDVCGYTARAVRLPGVVSEGDTEAEALENIKDAFLTTIAAYLAEGSAIPFVPDTGERPQIKGVLERWILVHA